jgi:pimeloyl-ACP methyl ester carboxylesterase
MISQDPDVGILAIEFLQISMRMTGRPLDLHETCHAIATILDSLNIERFVLVSHSYGTVVSTHLLHSPDMAPRIAATVFIDPIPFLLHLPNVAYNFVYRKPREANEWQLWFFASRDPDVSRTLSRHFFWSENVMWKEELRGKKTAVVLSGADQIVPTGQVWKYLTGEEEVKEFWEKDDLQVLYCHGLDHATVFDTEQRRRPVLDVVHRFVAPA